jgi:hypothetical protein
MKNYMRARFEVLTAVMLKLQVFWDDNVSTGKWLGLPTFWISLLAFIFRDQQHKTLFFF